MLKDRVINKDAFRKSLIISKGNNLKVPHQSGRSIVYGSENKQIRHFCKISVVSTENEQIRHFYKISAVSTLVIFSEVNIL